MTSGRQDDAFTITALNSAPDAQAARMLDTILERSPWLAQRVALARPFADLTAVGDAIAAEIATLSTPEQMRLLRAHPELAPPAPDAMTAASQDEQARLRLSRPAEETAAALRELNQRYRARHGFPFIVALHEISDTDAVVARFAASLDRDTDAEMTRALDAVVSVARARLARRVAADPEAASPATAALRRMSAP